VEIRTKSPKPKGIIELKTEVRKVVAFEIELSNPLLEPIFFDVIVKGSGLYGKDIFELGAKRSGVYELMFSPLRDFIE